MSVRVVIGVQSCVEVLDAPHHSSFHAYLDCVTDTLKADPVMIPCMGLKCGPDGPGTPPDYGPLVRRLDGVLLTGAPTHVNPSLYGMENLTTTADGFVDETKLDHDRDATSIAVIHACIKERVPLFGICRGMQEINVALGGSLQQKLESEQLIDNHRAHLGSRFVDKYRRLHKIRLAEGGLFEHECRRQGMSQTAHEVNSLHRQAIDRLANDLVVEALSEDGIIEAVTLKGSEGRVMGVQWHPEWFSQEIPMHKFVLEIFRAHCIQRAVGRLRPELNEC